MAIAAGSHEEKWVAIARWADKYTARFDQELTTAWPDLADRLEEGLASLSWSELAFGPGKDFERRCIQPAAERWTDRYVLPIVDDASAELQPILTQSQIDLTGKAPTDLNMKGNLQTLDVVKALTLPAGIFVSVGTIAGAIVTTTKLIVLTTVVVHWPLLIAGLLIGGTLTVFGGTQLARLKEKLQRRFRSKMLPRIKSGFVGEGIEHKGERIPSLLTQFKRRVLATAEAAREALRRVGELQ